jgi:hypothetical protein
MNDTNDRVDEGRLDDTTNAVTAEYQALIDSPIDPGEPDEATPDSQVGVSGEATAYLLLARLEMEVNQLHEKWEDIDAELKARDLDR